MKISNTKNKIISWAFYDWANSAFAITVLAGFFPLFFKQYWSGEAAATTSTFYLGLANSLAGLTLAFMAPFLGTLADYGGHRKRYLFIFMLIGSLATMALYFPEQGQWSLAVFGFVIGNLGFAGGNIFYDSLLIDVTEGKKMDQVSGLGYGLGYIGGALIFTLNVVMFLKPELFGLKDQVAGIKWSFVTVGIWWILFAIPLFVFVEDKSKENLEKVSFGGAWGKVKETFLMIIKDKPILLFLLAYFCYIEGANTVIKMSVDYGLSLGFESKNMIIALLIVNFAAFPAAIGFGIAAEKYGAIRCLFISIAGYFVICVLGSQVQTVTHFYALGVMIALFQGGLQAISRSYFARIVEPAKAAQYFGFFNLFGKFSAILGPTLLGAIALITQSPRWSIVSIAVFFLVGGVLLRSHQKIREF